MFRLNGLHAAGYGLLCAGLLALTPGAARAGANVAVTKVETTPQPAVVGKLLVYSVTFTNKGPDPGPVRLFTHHDAQWAMRDINLYRANGTKYPNAQTISPGEPYNDLETDIPSMAVGESLTLKVDVVPPSTGTFEITARVVADGQDPDPTANSATAQVTVGTGGHTNLPPELRLFGVAPNVIAQPQTALVVRPLQTVFASVALAAKAKKATRVQIVLEGTTQPPISVLIPGNKTAPNSTHAQPYPVAITLPYFDRPQSLVLRATVVGASPTDPRYTQAVNLAVNPLGPPLLVTGAGRGAAALVNAFQAPGQPSAPGQPAARLFPPPGQPAALSFLAFDAAFQGGVRVAVGDVNGDGWTDIVAGAGPGGSSRVKVFSGTNGSLLQDFVAFDAAFTGGVSVATGDVNGDGRADIIVGAGAGTIPLVRVFDGVTGGALATYLAFPGAFRGGVNVAAGDLNGDGIAEVVAGTASGASQVRVLNGMTGRQLLAFFPAGPTDHAGVNVAVGDVTGDGHPEIITGSGAGSVPIVRIFDNAGKAHGTLLPYPPAFTGGVTVAAADFDGDGRADIVTSPGAGGPPNVRIFKAADGSTLASFFAYDPGMTAGVFVAAGN